jgi:hypothetical protein
MREQRQLELLNAIHPMIVKECLRNESKTGYLQLYVDNDFNLIESSVEFIDGGFDSGEFVQREPIKPIAPERVKDAINIYYSILWWDNKTKWNVKELVLIAEY